MMNLDFPRLGTIQQAAEASGIPVYRVRQLCKAGTVRSVQCGRKTLVNLTSLAAWMDGGEPPPQPGIHRVVMTTKIAVQRVAARQTAKGWRKAGKPISTPILSF